MLNSITHRTEINLRHQSRFSIQIAHIAFPEASLPCREFDPYSLFEPNALIPTFDQFSSAIHGLFPVFREA
jgi:hypothetical protein